MLTPEQITELEDCAVRLTYWLDNELPRRACREVRTVLAEIDRRLAAARGIRPARTLAELHARWRAIRGTSGLAL